MTTTKKQSTAEFIRFLWEVWNSIPDSVTHHEAVQMLGAICNQHNVSIKSEETRMIEIETEVYGYSTEDEQNQNHVADERAEYEAYYRHSKSVEDWLDQELNNQHTDQEHFEYIMADLLDFSKYTGRIAPEPEPAKDLPYTPKLQWDRTSLREAGINRYVTAEGTVLYEKDGTEIEEFQCTLPNGTRVFRASVFGKGLQAEFQCSEPDLLPDQLQRTINMHHEWMEQQFKFFSKEGQGTPEELSTPPNHGW